jgi:integrase
MDRGKLPHYVDLYLESGFWKLRIDMDSINANGLEEHLWRDPAWIGPATGPNRLTKKEVQRIAWENFLARINPGMLARKTGMTIADFVESKFVPEHVASKGAAGRTHYKAILKHVLEPEEVQRIFGEDTERSRVKLKAIPDWPYLSNMRLLDVRPGHVEKLTSAATERGYSTQTVTHIRNVVSAIFSHAQKKQFFHGENPASLVVLPGMNRKEAHALTLDQTRSVLEIMRYPEKEMTLTAILTSMNVAEICGLQWKFVNLSAEPVESENGIIPPRTIAIRRQWYRGQLSDVKNTRGRNLPIPDALLPALVRLKDRPRFKEPCDFVFVSQAGTPINETNVASRRLKAIGGELNMPWLSWQVFRRTHKALLYNFGADYQSHVALAFRH